MDMAVIMFYVYYVAMAGVVFGVVATSSQEGIWSSIVLTFNILFAYLFALNFVEPLAGFLADMVPEGAYYWDVVCFMGVFAIMLLIGREVTKMLSRHRVKFPDQLENVGKYAAAFIPALALLGVLAICFQVAPLPKNLDKEPTAVGGSPILGDAMLLRPASDAASYWSYGPFAPISFDFEPLTNYYNSGDKFINGYAMRRAYFGSDAAAQKGMFISDK
ncbi:MAG TPA: hypothetical protein VGE52_00860 [Pirellulales bacterium]